MEVILTLTLIAFAQALYGFPLNQKCEWIHNGTANLVDLPQHKYLIIEECLYYFLSAEADKVQDKPNALAVLPPTKEPGDQITVTVDQMLVKQLWLNELWQEMHLSGHMQLSWTDYRMKWDEIKWKTKQMPVKSFGHIWVPDMSIGMYGSAAQGSNYAAFKDIIAHSDGNITARLTYRIQAHCEVNFEKFPEDRVNCQFHMHSELFEKVLRFKLNTGKGTMDDDTSATTWHVDGIKLAISRYEPHPWEFLSVSIMAQRQSASLKLELTLPMVICSILVLLAPLFGSFNRQIYAKMFSLLLQFLCFQFLVDKTPQIGAGDNVPNIYKFFEFTIAMTLISIIITLLASAISRKRRDVPPPHRVVLFAAAANSYLCCSEGNTVTDNKGDATNYRQDWAEIYACGNNVISLIMIGCYVFGILVLCS